MQEDLAVHKKISEAYRGGGGRWVGGGLGKVRQRGFDPTNDGWRVADDNANTSAEPLLLTEQQTTLARVSKVE